MILISRLYYCSFYLLYRRGDFEDQYKEMIVNASVLYDSCKDIIPPNSTVYVATDERNKDYFQSLAYHFDLVYLDDFLPLIQGLNTNYYGMLDQLIASKSRYFFGVYYCIVLTHFSFLHGKTRLMKIVIRSCNRYILLYIFRLYQ